MAEAGADPAQALPIDIAYNKLAVLNLEPLHREKHIEIEQQGTETEQCRLDWLVDRRKVPPDWRKRLATVHAKVSAALSTLPRSVDPGFLNLNPDCTGYLEAKHIKDVLLSELPESRSFFGRPAGAAGDWDAIVSAYEKDSIFLGEAAQIMVQSTNYDIPYQKRQVAKLQQQLADLDRKESEVKRNAVQSAAKYQQACQELGIPVKFPPSIQQSFPISGVHVRTELVGLGKTLPNIFRDVVEGLCGDLVGSALEYYRAFSSYANEVQGDESALVLPTLMDLRSHPPDIDADLNATSFISVTQSDHSIENQSVTETDVNTKEIDWAVAAEDLDTSVPLDIDWDIGTLEDIDVQDRSAPYPEQEAHNESNDAQPLPEGGHVEDSQLMPEISWDVDSPREIDWDIDVEEDGMNSTHDLSQKMDAKTENEGTHLEKVDGGKNAPTSWFAKTENRSRLLDDLFELKVFLKQRLQEIESEETSALQNQVQVVAPPSIPQHGSESLIAMTSSVAKALNLVTNRRTRDLILISTSIRYLDRLEASLTHKKQNELNLQKNIGDLSSKRLELRSAQALLWPKQEAVVARTQAVKQHVEKVLSAQYNGRKVNIIGEINTLLGQT